MTQAPEDCGLCNHIRAGSWPFHVRLVLDDHLGFTDALVACRHCGANYLLEMLDCLDNDRVMRISVPPRDHAEGVIRDVGRGSCDLSRAGQEIHHLRTGTPLCPVLLLVNWSGPSITAVVATPDQERLPAASWRDLPCDGGWVRYARSKTDMVNR